MLVPKHRNSSVVFQTFLYSLCICVLSYNPDTGTIYRRGVQARADFENILMGRQTSLSPAVRARIHVYVLPKSSEWSEGEGGTRYRNGSKTLRLLFVIVSNNTRPKHARRGPTHYLLVQCCCFWKIKKKVHSAYKKIHDNRYIYIYILHKAFACKIKSDRFYAVC